VSVSVQIISKTSGKYKVFKTIGSSFYPNQIEKYYVQALNEINNLGNQLSFIVEEKDVLIDSFIDGISNSQIEVIGPELVFGRIFDYIGYGAIQESLFRHLVITRLVYPGSKLKTIEYLQRYQNLEISIDSIYRFLDTLQSKLKEQVVGTDGFAIGYDIFEGNISEGHTLIPMIKKFENRFKLNKPVVIADSGILSKDNIKSLEDNQYEYIIGARIKNETEKIKEKILSLNLTNGKPVSIKKDDTASLIEKAFRISKTDLRIRPIYHHLRKRIEAHICISFVAYGIYMDLERVLKLSDARFSVKKAFEMTQNMYQIKYVLPKSLRETAKTLKMDENQRKLIEIINQYF
jgi:hypothetical protein